MSERVRNFSAGPSTMPLPVLEQLRDELVEYDDLGRSLLESSHRGEHYDAVHHEAMELARQVFAVPDDMRVLFVQGGATLQFSMVPANLLADGGSAAVARTGAWSRKAFADAQVHGGAHLAWDGEPNGYTSVPAAHELELRDDDRYLHVCSNETIEGIRFTDFPDAGVPLVADMSSDIATRRLPWDLFDVVYAGTQKNLGPPGMAVVFVRDRVLDEAPDELGAYLRYDVHAKKDSMHNTPPVFTVWATGKVLRWILDQGGLDAMAEAAERKSGVVYDVIDSSDGFYTGPARVEDRSLTNVVFRPPDQEATARFLAEAAERRFVGLKGHRSVGGCRASLYNAMAQEGAEDLAQFMVDFRQRA